MMVAAMVYLSWVRIIRCACFVQYSVMHGTALYRESNELYENISVRLENPFQLFW